VIGSAQAVNAGTDDQVLCPTGCFHDLRQTPEHWGQL
jgi:hypothetical protein